ncbi:MAG: FAD-dependent oxidoreductase [Planctomycetota bacterium]
MTEARNPTGGNGSSNPVGAVLVVGGGIGGMQASLDLAESGFKVYLVEEKPAIGGRMAQLDKTFPTNDCSMCIMSPKLVEVGRHRNIELLTNTDVTGIAGEPGRYTVNLHRRPRFVDIDKCTACAECTKVCPVDLPNIFDVGMSGRKATFKLYPQATPNAYGVDKAGVSPCRDACPGGLNAHAYVTLAGAGRYDRAMEIVRDTVLFPGILGRVCPHPCETACLRGTVDEPVRICSIKRFLADRESGAVPVPELPPTNGKKVAVVGAGPAGLSAAYDLRKKGVAVTIYDAAAKIGGMMAYGIPEYRLPREVLKKETEDLMAAMGVEFKMNTRIGKDVPFEKLQADADAVLLAVGAWKGMPMKAPGEDQQGVFQGVDFVVAVNGGEKPSIGPRVAIIGGGNTAVDAARCAVRLGCQDVTIVYRRSRKEMPANPEEVDAAEEEGIQLRFLAAPVSVKGSGGKVTGLEVQKMKLGEPDASGRRRPVPMEGTEEVIPVDTVIPAIGQRVDLAGFEGEGMPALTRWGTFEVDEKTGATSVEGIFAAGDAVSGADTVIGAIAGGRKAAESIARFLKGEDIAEGRGDDGRPVVKETDTSRAVPGDRAAMSELTVSERKSNFQEVEKGLDEAAVQAEAKRCLSCAGCCECLECVPACLPEAFLHDSVARDLSVEVGSVILTPGYEQFEAERKGEFGYGRYPNVLTSLEFERVLSASGPSLGHLERPSDKKAPKRVAWIQCVGSREPAGKNEYCSAVCCMFAAKQAVIAMEHDPEVKATMFYMDARAYGKEFDAYFERAESEKGVRMVRSMVSRVIERPATKNLELTWQGEDGKAVAEEFDMVVLSAGLEAGESAKKAAQALGVELNDYGFCRTTALAPIDTNVRGVFVCGAFQGPKDIPETVAQASGAAGRAGAMLAASKGSLVTERTFPEELDVSGQEARIGVFVCRCGINIANTVDVPAVAEFAKTLPNVVFVDENLFSCSQDTQIKIVELVKEHQLNRAVVASCSPRTHEPLFRETVREAGLNPFFFEMANIRDQCSWVHQEDKEGATAKAKALVRMAVAKAALNHALHMTEVEVTPRALVVGGGLSGITAALGFAENGYETYLVEREQALGGNLRHIRFIIDGSDPKTYLQDLLARLEAQPLIKVFTGAEIADFTGHIGKFTSGIRRNGGERIELTHGVVVVATGAEEVRPKAYLLGENDRVVTQVELEEKIDKGDGIKDLKSVVMIQCVGSRDEERPYCSRVCCMNAVKNALKIKEINPAASVAILYRDVRTYGFLEKYYREAREKGVLFLRYEPSAKPEVKAEGGGLTVRVLDRILGRDLILDADLVALSTGMQPRGNEALATHLKVPLMASKYFLEAHMKLRPVDFASEGIFLCGLAHSPKNIPESLAQASAAVARGCTVLSKEKLTVGGAVSVVDPEHCVACLTCVRACPYGVPVINADGVAYIEVAQCQGCGICAAECPRKAIELEHYRDTQILAKTCAQFD